jgi:hypothetical protein
LGGQIGVTKGSGVTLGVTVAEVVPQDLTDDEKAALVDLLAGVIESDRFPLSPRVQLLRRILAKLRDNPAAATVERETTRPLPVRS